VADSPRGATFLQAGHGIIATVQPAETGKATPKNDEQEPMLYCPVCSTRLKEHKCKLVCETCGYYLSCADYY
jgi:hypothetical protein